MTTRPSGGRIANRKSPTITDRTYRAPPGTTVPSTRPPSAWVAGRFQINVWSLVEWSSNTDHQTLGRARNLR
jgi:hypothetical protein